MSENLISLQDIEAFNLSFRRTLPDSLLSHVSDNVVPIHLRTSNFKPDISIYESARNSSPNNYNAAYTLFSEQNFSPLFLSGSSDDVRGGYKYLIANSPSSATTQILALLKAKYLLLTSSGISHLSILNPCPRLFINNIGFDGDCPKYQREFFLLKRLVIKSKSSYSYLSSISRTTLISAILQKT